MMRGVLKKTFINIIDSHDNVAQRPERSVVCRRVVGSSPVQATL